MSALPQRMNCLPRSTATGPRRIVAAACRSDNAGRRASRSRTSTRQARSTSSRLSMRASTDPDSVSQETALICRLEADPAFDRQAVVVLRCGLGIGSRLQLGEAAIGEILRARRRSAAPAESAGDDHNGFRSACSVKSSSLSGTLYSSLSSVRIVRLFRRRSFISSRRPVQMPCTCAKSLYFKRRTTCVLM